MSYLSSSALGVLSLFILSWASPALFRGPDDNSAQHCGPDREESSPGVLGTMRTTTGSSAYGATSSTPGCAGVEQYIARDETSVLEIERNKL